MEKTPDKCLVSLECALADELQHRAEIEGLGMQDLVARVLWDYVRPNPGSASGRERRVHARRNVHVSSVLYYSMNAGQVGRYCGATLCNLSASGLGVHVRGYCHESLRAVKSFEILFRLSGFAEAFRVVCDVCRRMVDEGGMFIGARFRECVPLFEV